jgi:hypothetical protein
VPGSLSSFLVKITPQAQIICFREYFFDFLAIAVCFSCERDRYFLQARFTSAWLAVGVCASELNETENINVKVKTNNTQRILPSRKSSAPS